MEEDSSDRIDQTLGKSRLVRSSTKRAHLPLPPPPLCHSNVMVSRRSRIYLKLDNLQPSGSFKSRGLGNLVVKSYNNARDPHKLHYFAASGGNAGLGCVYAANFVKRPATVVVPLSTKQHMIEKLYAAGAKAVMQHGANIAEATAYVNDVLMPLSREQGEEPFYVDPFNHPDIWEGHESIVDEMREQFEEMGEDAAPDWIICSCGGGGLFNGVMAGIERQGREWQKTGVIAVETEGADSLNKALEWNEHKAISHITSIATSLGCVKISERTWDIVRPALKSGKARNIVLSDAEAAMGSWKLAEEERIIVEAACGVNIALCYGERLEKALGRPPRPDESFVRTTHPSPIVDNNNNPLTNAKTHHPPGHRRLRRLQRLHRHDRRVQTYIPPPRRAQSSQHPHRTLPEPHQHEHAPPHRARQEGQCARH